MVAQPKYSSPPSASDAGRRYSRPGPLSSYHGAPYFASPERRYQLPYHHATSSTTGSQQAAQMADQQQLDSDSGQQRKRIAVACGRCRKRKIRCSGDPGHGLPCSNCKNAGADPCLFLRVSSREAPLRDESADFSYSVNDARAYASRASPFPHGLTYSPETAAGPNDAALVYRSSSGSAGYPYPTSKGYYPAASMSSGGYGPSYAADEFDSYAAAAGMPGVPGHQPVLSHDPVTGHLNGMIPWGAATTSRAKTPAAIYSSGMQYHVDAEPTAYGYATNTPTALVHRPVHHTSSPSFSYSGVATTSLPSTPSAERVLPYPATGVPGSGRSSTLPYLPGPPLKSATPAPTPAESPVSYHPYPPAAVTSAPYQATQSAERTTISAATVDTYATGAADIGGLPNEHEHKWSGASFDHGAYSMAAETRRPSHSRSHDHHLYLPAGKPGSGLLFQSPGDPSYGAAAAQAGYVTTSPTASPRRGHGHGHGHHGGHRGSCSGSGLASYGHGGGHHTADAGSNTIGGGSGGSGSSGAANGGGSTSLGHAEGSGRRVSVASRR